MIALFDEFELDAANLELRRAGKSLKADRLLLRILSALVRRAGRLVTKQDLVQDAWGDRVVTDNALTVAMARLRKLLGDERESREFIVTLRGSGYRFVRPVSMRAPMDAAPVMTRTGERVTRPPAFVGRDRVMKQLRFALEEARDGRGSACMLFGEPGIGKTRAVEILASEAAAADMPVAWGYCREVGDTPPLWPFAQVVRQLLAKVPLESAGPEFAQLVPRLRPMLPELVGPAGAAEETYPSPRVRYKIFDATSHVLALVARTQPCVVVLDDLHRADPASLELLRYLIDELSASRIALYGMVRPTDNPGPHLSYVMGHRNVARITLQPLTERDVGAYVTGILSEPHPALAHAVYLKSEGNPFFMTELLRHARERENIEPEHLRVPDAALELVRQRAAILDDAARGVLSRAAVIGRHFDLLVLHTLAGGTLEALMATLDEALARGIVTDDANSTTEFAFAHVLLRSALYDALPRGERRALHLRVAEALEARAQSGDAVSTTDLAYHYRAALPAGDVRKVVEYCRAAAREAAQVLAYTDAARHVRHARKALDLLERPSPRMRMSLFLQEAMFVQSYSSRQAEPLLREAIEIARVHRAGVAMAGAALLLDPYRGTISPPDAKDLIEESLGLLSEDAFGMRAALHARRAALPPLAYNAELAAAELQRARQMAEASQDSVALYGVRVSELYLFLGPDRRRDAEVAMDEIDRMARSDLSVTMQTMLRESYTAIAALQDGELDAMHGAIERGAAYCRQVDSDRLWYFERFAAVARINAGEKAEGLASLEALHRRARSSSSPTRELLSAYDECVVLQSASKLPKHALREIFAHGEGDPPNIWALKVRALAAVGMDEDARELIGRVPPHRLADLPHDRDYLGTLGALARAAIELRMPAYITSVYALLVPYPERYAGNLSFFCEGRVSELLASLDAARRTL